MIITSDQLTNLQESTTGWTLRAYVPENFHDSEGNLVLGSGRDSRGAYFSANFTTNAVPEIDIPHTSNALTPGDEEPRYSLLGIYDSRNRLKYILLTNFVVPEQLGETATLTELILVNTTNSLPYNIRDEFYTARTSDRLFLKRTELDSTLQEILDQIDDRFVYIGYAEDAAGAGYSTSPGESRDYIAFLGSEVAITPVAADFAGLWKKYRGEQGPQGIQGIQGIPGAGLPAGWYNVKDYGASGSKQTTTGGITSGTPNLTLASALDFEDGQGIKIMGAGTAGAPLVTTIVSGAGTVNLVLADNAATTVAGAVVSHDDGEAINAAIVAVNALNGGVIYFPPGKYNHYDQILISNAYGIKFKGDGEAQKWLWSPADKEPVCAVVYTADGTTPGWKVTTCQGLAWEGLCISYDNYSFTGPLIKIGGSGGANYLGWGKFEQCQLQSWYSDLLSASDIILCPFWIWGVVRDCAVYGAEYLIRGIDTGVNESANSITIDHNLLQGGREGFIANMGDYWTVKDNTIEGYPFSIGGTPTLPTAIITDKTAGLMSATFNFYNNQFWDNTDGGMASPGTTFCVDQPAGSTWSADFYGNFFDATWYQTHFRFNGLGPVRVRNNTFAKVFSTTTPPVIDLGVPPGALKELVEVTGNSIYSASNEMSLVGNIAGHKNVNIERNSHGGWTREMITIGGHQRLARVGNAGLSDPVMSNLATNFDAWSGSSVDSGGWFVWRALGGDIAAGLLFELTFAEEWIPNGTAADAQIPLVQITPFGYGPASGADSYAAGFYYHAYNTSDRRIKISFYCKNLIPQNTYVGFVFNVVLAA